MTYFIIIINYFVLILYNLVFFSDTSQNTNLLGAVSEVTTMSDPYDAFSKLKVYTVIL